MNLTPSLDKKRWDANASWPFAHRTSKCKKQWCSVTICTCNTWWNVPSHTVAGNQIYTAYPVPDSLGTDEVFHISTARHWEQHSCLCTPRGAQTSLLYYEVYYDIKKKLSTRHFVSGLTRHACCSMLSNTMIVSCNKTMPKTQLRVMSRDHFGEITGFSDHTISKVRHGNIKNLSLSDAIFLSTSSSFFCFQTNSVPLSSARKRLLSLPSTVNNLSTERSQTSSPSTNTSRVRTQEKKR